MAMTTFAERLTACLDKENFPPKNYGRIQLLAEMVGLSHRGASKWLNGQTSPPASKYAALAKKLNVDETWLRTGEGGMNSEPESKSTDNTTNVSTDPPMYTLEALMIAQKTAMLPRFFKITLSTEAMSPRFPNGTILIFDTAREPKDGDFILINFPGYPEPLFRQLLVFSSSMYLHAGNPKFDRLVFTKESTLIGTLASATVLFS